MPQAPTRWLDLPTGAYLNSGVRSSTITYLNNSGLSTGTSRQYVGGTAANYNTIAWVNPAGGSPTALGLTGGAYSLPSTGSNYTPDKVTELTNSGLVGGYSDRYSGTSVVGQDAWIYNQTTNSYSTLEPDPALLTGYAGYFSDTITYLSETGFAVGDFQLSSGGATYAFLWTPGGGFDDLTNDPPNRCSTWLDTLHRIDECLLHRPNRSKYLFHRRCIERGRRTNANWRRDHQRS